MRGLLISCLLMTLGHVSAGFAASSNAPIFNAQQSLIGVRYPSENWAAARNLAGQVDWDRWLQEGRQRLDKWMLVGKEEHDKSVGWVHDYVEYGSGKSILWSPGSSPPSTADLKQHAAWRAHVRVYNIGQVREAARFFRLTGDIRYLAWARSQLDAYAANYGGLKLQTWNGDARLFSQALDEAVHAFSLIEAVRLLQADVSKDDIRRWRADLFVPMTENLRRSCRNGGNITVWLAAAISAIAAQFELSDAQEFAMHSEYGLPQLLANGVSADYFWFEMSLQYQDYVVRALAEWMYAIGIRKGRQTGVSDAQYQGIGNTAHGLMMAPLAVRFANMEQPMINDGIRLGRIPNRELWGAVWRELPTGEGVAQAALVRNWDTLLDSPPEIPSAELPRVVSQRVDGLYAVQLVGRNWQALMRYGQRSPGHAHQESLTYDLQYNGIWIFRDIGTVGYGSPLHANFFRRAQAQNVPLVDRDGQQPWPSVGRLAAFDAMALTARAEHENYRPGVRVARSLRIGERHFVDRVEFDLDKKAAPVGVVFNTPCSVEPLDGIQATASSTLGDIGGFRYWTGRQQFDANTEIRLNLNCDGGDFAVKVSGMLIKSLFLAKTPTAQGAAKREGIFVETSAVKKTSIELMIEPR